MEELDPSQQHAHGQAAVPCPLDQSIDHQNTNVNDGTPHGQQQPHAAELESALLKQFPALRQGFQGESIEEVRSQWLRYNQTRQKDVATLSSDIRKGLWKSICACVKVKTVKDWKTNEICQAHLFVSRNMVKSVQFHHTCTSQHVGRKRNYKAAQLAIDAQNLNLSSATNKRKVAEEVVQAAQTAGFQLKRTQAYRVAFALSRQPIELQIGAFYLLPSIFQAWKRADPDGTYILDTTTPSWKPNALQFQRYYISPSLGKHAWKHSQIRLFITDASPTATTWSSFNMSMMAAVTLDGNDEAVLLAVALCDSDSEWNWVWFLQNLLRDYSNIQIVLTNSKCLTEGTNSSNLLQLMDAVPSTCVSSLSQSVEQLQSIELPPEDKQQILELAKATTLQDYDAQIRSFAQTNPDVAVWLDERKQQFVSYNFLQQQPKRPRFGKVESNANVLIETIQEVKDQPVASMTVSLLMNLSSIHFQRRQKAQQWLDQGQEISNYAKGLYSEILEASEICQVQILSQDGDTCKAIVSQPQGDAVPSFVVTANATLFQLVCSCSYTEEMGLPCVHGAALIRSQTNLDPYSLGWFHPRYHCTTLVQMYNAEPPDYSLFGKVSSQEVVPPDYKPAGPLKRRKVPTVAPNNPHKCAACGGLGHHPKTCYNPSTQYRYEQFADKAKEWAESACEIQTVTFF